MVHQSHCRGTEKSVLPQKSPRWGHVRHEHLESATSSATRRAKKRTGATHVVPEIAVGQHRVHRQAVEPVFRRLHPLHPFAQARRVDPRLEVRLHPRLRRRGSRASARPRSRSTTGTLVLDERAEEACVCEAWVSSGARARRKGRTEGRSVRLVDCAALEHVGDVVDERQGGAFVDDGGESRRDEFCAPMIVSSIAARTEAGLTEQESSSVREVHEGAVHGVAKDTTRSKEVSSDSCWRQSQQARRRRRGESSTHG